jgi:hypothetical protein
MSVTVAGLLCLFFTFMGIVIGDFNANEKSERR